MSFKDEREMHKATCADCGKECEVPFKPDEDRPVYCKDCFQKHKLLLMDGVPIVNIPPPEPRRIEKEGLSFRQSPPGNAPGTEKSRRARHRIKYGT